MDSVLLVPTPEAEPVVGSWRSQHDSSAKDGIPAHVTILFPFLRESEITDEAVNIVEGIAKTTTIFEIDFTSFGWFGTQVGFLLPNTTTPFEMLTNRMVEAFPCHPPYEGQFDDIIPHLTIGDDGHHSLVQAEQLMREHLPIRSKARELWWMQGDIGKPWKVIHRFDFIDGKQ